MLIRRKVILLLVMLLSFMLMGAGNIEVYFGTVRATTKDGRMTLMLKNSGEKTVKMNKETKVFAGGRIVPSTRIKPNSHVQAAVNGDGLCLQVVVEEGPK